jgi:large subunit ribosomal protein L9
LAGKDVVIIENASDDGRLYGSVSSSTIATKINEILNQKILSRGNIFLKKPIKDIGIHEVKISLHSEVEIEARLIVTRSESEINALLKAEKKSEKSGEVSEKKPEAKIISEELKEEVSETKSKKPRKKKESAE